MAPGAVLGRCFIFVREERRVCHAKPRRAWLFVRNPAGFLLGVLLDINVLSKTEAGVTETASPATRKALCRKSGVLRAGEKNIAPAKPGFCGLSRHLLPEGSFLSKLLWLWVDVLCTTAPEWSILSSGSLFCHGGPDCG